MEKPTFNKERTADLFEELFSALGHQNTSGQGMFHKKFIRVCSSLCARFLLFKCCAALKYVFFFLKSGQNTVCVITSFPLFF